MPRSKLPVVVLLLAAVAGAIWLFWSRGDAAPAPTPNAPETNRTADTSDGELAATDVQSGQGGWPPSTRMGHDRARPTQANPLHHRL